ncbi:hypothetical protein G7A66_03935 [Altererythrobacter sp. SALINAS58]|uniref:hypothetical protein n=1 Tax=Alteripontixanthobacter muriae TaxID=2705546 RepID=UPI001577380E|nr:hypothetical protein [Alteripontixanthobacter muriae]NTZ42258.1 hypothetical protein [Alteripontixanthobacter muriae]
MKHLMNGRTLLFLGSAALLPGSAHAQDNADSAYIESLRACQNVPSDSERLACYDRSVAAVTQATDQGELRILDREAVSQTRRRLFGFSLPDIDIFKTRGDQGDQELETLTSTVTAVRKLREDAFLFQIADGGTWQILNAPSRLRRIEVGDSVEFKKAALGTYFVRVNGGIGVKGRRVR